MATTTRRSNSTTTRVRLAPPTRFDYRPGLDGVRALAVVAVLLYHVDVTWIPGGFLGVETFFVLSGYLITALLLSETAEEGRVSLRAFWGRRARRLLPAAYALLAGVVGAAAVFREELARVIDELPAALLYVYNWLPIVSEESYFEFMGRPSPLRHLWSLAIEEQFYLLWPLVLVWAMRSGGRRRLGFVALGGATLSAVAMVLMAEPGIDPSRVYYGTDTRAAGLLIGALGAIIWHPSRTVGLRHRRALAVAGAAGMAGLVAAFLKVSEFGSFLYGGGFVLISIASLGITLAAADSGGPFARILGLAPLRWLGTRSYAIYLWHWPVVVFTRPGIDVPFDGFAVMAFRVLVSLLLADVSYRLIESRFRARRTTAPSTRPFSPAPVGFPRRALAGLAVVILFTSVAAVGWDAPAGGPPADVALASEDLATSDVTSETSEAAPSTTSAPVLTSTTGAEAGDSTTTTVGPSTSVAPPDPTPNTKLVDETKNSNEKKKATNPEQGKKKKTTSTTSAGEGEPDGTAATPDLDSASFTPPTTTPPPPPPSVTAIGDSVMAGAVAQLEKAYDGPIDVDAEVGRSFEAGVQVLQEKAGDGGLGDVVVIHLGNNGLVDPEQVKRLVEVAGKKRPVIFVNVRVPRRWQELVNSSLAESVPAHPNATLVDWYAHSEGKQKWFNSDGLHIVDTPGAPAYAQLIVGAVEAAASS